MTTQLTERLRTLADDAPAALTAADLWETGRRRHRGRVVAAAVTAAAVVTTVAVAGFGSWHARQADPAAPKPTVTGSMAIPARFFHPSPWLPGTTSPGRLVAVLGTERGHFPFGQDLSAWVGVTAGSQTYRFLDLPGQAIDSDVALSPDGRHIGYWVNGAPLGAATIGDRSMVGVAILDLTTGQIERHVVPTQHGIYPTSLGWVDDDTLAMGSGQYTSSRVTSYGARTSVRLFTVGEPAAVTLPRSNVLPVPVVATGGVYAGVLGGRRLRTYDLTGQVTRTARTSVPLRSVAYDATHGRVVGTRGHNRGDSTDGPLVVGRLAHGHVQLSAVPGGHYLDALGWADAGHVVAEQLTPTGELFWVVDVHTGERVALTGTGYQATGSRWFGVVLAAGALRHPTTVPAVEPPHPWNPRWVAGGVLGGLVLVGVVLLLVRRSRRVRG